MLAGSGVKKGSPKSLQNTGKGCVCVWGGMGGGELLRMTSKNREGGGGWGLGI